MAMGKQVLDRRIQKTQNLLREALHALIGIHEILNSVQSVPPSFMNTCARYSLN